MSKFVTLTKVLLKTNGESFSKSSGKFKFKGIALMVFLILCFAPLAISLGAFVNTLYDMLSQIDQQGVILGLGFSMSCLAIFFLGIFYVIGTFYFSMDINYLLPLPFRPSEILSSKLVVVLVYEYLTQLIILAPIIIAYGIKDGAGILYYIFGILIFLTIPVIPLVISSILVMIIMRFTNAAKNKDRFSMIGGMIAISIGIGINIVTQRIASNFTNPENIQRLFEEGNNSLIGLTTKLFPSAKLAAAALAENVSSRGLINLGLFIAITLASLIIFIFIGEGLYFKGVIGISEAASRRKQLSNAELYKATEQNSVLKAYTIKELKILFRTPAYFLNCVVINFFWPILLILPLVINPDNMKNLEMIKNFLNTPDYFPIILAGSSLLLAFVASTNGVASTSISREGKSLFVNKFLPISYKDQIMAKVLSGIIISIIGMVTLIFALIVVAKPSPLLVILITIIGLFVIFSSNFIGILIDLFNPKLNWDNEQKAVKQNLNLLISWPFTLILPGIITFAVYKFHLTMSVTAALLLFVYIAANLILYKVLTSKGTDLYNKIQNN
jgi:ABC-2 type transport system permease protein